MREIAPSRGGAVEGRHTSERPPSENGGADHEVLVAADARVLAALQRVRGDLSVEIHRERAVDRDERAVARDDRRVVHLVDRQEAHELAAVAAEPVVELARAHREGRDRDAVVQALARVADLAGAVELHAARS